MAAVHCSIAFFQATVSALTSRFPLLHELKLLRFAVRRICNQFKLPKNLRGIIWKNEV